MSTRACPFCEDEAELISLKNGEWAAEPLEPYDIDPKGWLCAEWSENRLRLYIHERHQYE